MPNDFDLNLQPPALKWRTDTPATKWLIATAERDGGVMPAQISTLSTEYVTVAVSARESGAPVDPTSATVRFAFTAEGLTPGADDWTEGGWDTDSSVSPARYFARILVGPDDGVELAAGTYAVWVEITEDPETVIRTAGYLRVV